MAARDFVRQFASDPVAVAVVYTVIVICWMLASLDDD